MRRPAQQRIALAALTLVLAAACSDNDESPTPEPGAADTPEAVPAGGEPVPAAPVSPAIDTDDIGGVVASERGPEAGVWVIAETQDLPVTFRKIVVTNEAGEFVVPDLPSARYELWVRGYGLVDSERVGARPGERLALTALLAPTEQAAAQYYPPDYWFSLLAIPGEDEFPMTVPPSPPEAGIARGAPAPLIEPIVYANRAEWVHALKRGCQACHQMGTMATYQLPPGIRELGHEQAWRRRILSGQTGPGMVSAVSRLGEYDAAIAMFADWTRRITAGEVPPEPPRPEGLERNVVISLWDYASDRAFVHDVIATDKREPTSNPYGPIYGLDWSAGTVEALNPLRHTNRTLTVPLRDESRRDEMPRWSPQTNAAPSPYWGNEIVWDDPVNPNQPHMDGRGRIWFNTQTRPDQPEFCRTGSGNPFARAYPLDDPAKGVAVYDPSTGEFELIDTCFRGQHGIFANDPDDTMFFSMGVGVGWLNTRIWDETKDAEQAQGWCAAIMDYDGDGVIGEFTRPDEPVDPELDRQVSGAEGYGVAVNFVDGSAWYIAGVFSGRRDAAPGKLIRITPGENPPATCMTEVYEPPFENPDVDEDGYYMQGVDVDGNGLVWTALAGSAHLASFDRSRCTALNGPTATGQHCAEGWTLYPVPGPTFEGSDVRADWFYYNYVDIHGALGLGENVPIINGTGSDSLIAFLPETEQFVRLRLPYPMGYHTRGMNGRIDDPQAGWKGRGLWAANNNRVIWHTETGRGSRSYVAQFQVRPDALAH
jgi:hypothetical protein